jgi:protein-tyrosine phosphatase
MTSGPPRVLVVCTGNICRSPMGELLLRDGVNGLSVAERSVVIGSAGTYPGHAGEPMQPGAAEVMRERGISPEAFRATALTASLVDQADLVLTAERSHRAAVVRLAPSAVQRTFTVVEFGRLVAASGAVADAANTSPAHAFAHVLASATRMRGLVPAPEEPADDDIDDPYGMPVSEFRRCAARLDEAFAPLLSALSSAS